MVDHGIVIVGGGESGARAACSLRENGWAGAVTILGEEPLAPYERPPLSKSVLTDEGDPTPVLVVDPSRFEKLGIASVRGVQVVEIDRYRHKVVTHAHGEFRYERLILATGAKARHLSISGAEHSVTLRTFADSLAVRKRLRGGSKLVVIGGGFIGMEVAASARKLGVAVTVLEQAGRILSRAVPGDIACKLAARHEGEGVKLIVDCGIKRIKRQEYEYIVELADGRSVTADLVVAGVGSIPRTELAAAAGLEVDNGVAVNSALQTSDPDIFAIGDCCSFPHSVYGGKRIRLEAWRNAQDQGDYIGRSLSGHGGLYDAIPWFWSDQYDLDLQIVGLPSEGARTARRDLGDGAFIDFHVNNEGRLVGASALGAMEKIAKDARIAEKLIAARAAPDLGALSEPASKLRALLTK